MADLSLFQGGGEVPVGGVVSFAENLPDEIILNDGSAFIRNDNLILSGFNTTRFGVNGFFEQLWSTVNADLDFQFVRDVTEGANGVLCAVSNFGLISRSTDNGVTWTQVLNDPNFTNCEAMAYGNGTFIAAGTSGNCVRSIDNGLNWIVNVPLSISALSIGYGNGVWIAAGRNAGGRRSTDDGVSWANVSIGIVDDNADPRATITDGSGTWVISSNNTTVVARSTNDGLTWAGVTTPNSGGTLRGQAANGTFIIGCNGSKVLRSGDSGVTWSVIDAPLDAAINDFSKVATDGSGNWLGVASNGLGFSKSTDDGLTWTFNGLNPPINCNTVTYHSSKAWLAPRANGLIYTTRISVGVVGLTSFDYMRYV